MNDANFQYQLLDAETLLAPISSEQPSGVYLRYEPVYDDIINELKKGAQFHSPHEASGTISATRWQTVIDLCLQALQHQSKDLQIAVWLMQALLKTKGLTGLKEGLQLILQLLNRFWESLHPVSPTDPEVRLSPLIWLDNKLPSALNLVDLAPYQHLTDLNYAEEAPVCNLYQIHVSGNSAEATDPEQGLKAHFLQVAQQAPAGWHQQRVEELKDSLETLAQLKTLLQTAYGDEAPTYEQSFTVLGQLLTLHEQAAKQSKASEVTGSNDPKFAGLCEQLLALAKQLQADYPQCPTGYLVQQAVNYRAHSLQDVAQRLPDLQTEHLNHAEA